LRLGSFARASSLCGAFDQAGHCDRAWLIAQSGGKVIQKFGQW